MCTFFLLTFCKLVYTVICAACEECPVSMLCLLHKQLVPTIKNIAHFYVFKELYNMSRQG